MMLGKFAKWEKDGGINWLHPKETLSTPVASHQYVQIKEEFPAEEQMQLNYVQEGVCFEYRGSRLIAGNWVKN